MLSVITSLLIIATAALGSAGAESSSLAGSKPNIILILTDDQGYGDLGCHGHPFLKTPHLDQLHAASTRFTDFQVSPTCAPTRSALMSGRAPFEVGVTHTILERDRMALGVPTIAEVLKKAGYRTGIFGKWHLGDAAPYQPGQRGFDEVFIHGAGGIGQNYPGSQGDAPKNSYFDPIIRHNGKFVQTKGYCTDVFFSQTLRWITSEEGQDNQPFFAYLATNAPHGPYLVDSSYSAPYGGKCSKRSAAFFGMIANIDENVGKLIKALDAADLSKDTLIIFMTDNGTAAGTYNAGMKGRKGSVDEGGTHVPLFMKFPSKIPAGKDIPQLTRHYDIFPTLAALAGGDITDIKGLRGRNLLPLITEPEPAWPDRMTFFHKGRWPKAGAPGKWGKGDTNPESYQFKNFAVRNERWRLVGNRLYDIQSDPGQKTDLAATHPEVVQSMRSAYSDWWKKTRPKLVNEDATLDTPTAFEAAYLKQKAQGEIPSWPPSSD